jgi:hypothetical protein
MVEARVVSFRVSAEPGREVPLGAVPPEGRLVLKDFTSNAGHVRDYDMSRLRLVLLAGGSVIVEIPPLFEHDVSGMMIFWFNTHFSAGILVRGGERVTLRSDGPEPLLVTVGALMEVSTS